MGYQTSYSLKLSTPDNTTLSEEILKEVHAYLLKNEDFEWALDLGDGPLNNHYNPNSPCKWYDHEKDMKVLSKEFPYILFELSGEGEESGDIWTAYHLDGKVQEEQAEIVHGKFDKSKLK